MKNSGQREVRALTGGDIVKAMRNLRSKNK